MNDTPEMIIDDKKFGLFSDKDADNPTSARLFFSVYRGNPSINVWTNDDRDANKSKPIRAAMDAFGFGTFCELIRQATRLDANKKNFLVNRRGSPSKLFVDSRTIVGKDNEGVIWIALQMKDRPLKKFKLLPGIYLDILEDDGETVDKAKSSCTYAVAFANQLESHMSRCMDRTWQPPEVQKKAGNGGYGKPQSYSGGYTDNMPM